MGEENEQVSPDLLLDVAMGFPRQKHPSYPKTADNNLAKSKKNQNIICAGIYDRHKASTTGSGQGRDFSAGKSVRG